MANRLSDERVNAIASNYCTNDNKKVKALLSCGYSVNYANNSGLKLFDNERVKAAIKLIEDKTSEKTEITRELLDKMYLETYKLAKSNKHTAAMNGSIAGAARLRGWDKQTIQVDADELKELSEQEQAMADRLSKLTLIDGKVG